MDDRDVCRDVERRDDEDGEEEEEKEKEGMKERERCAQSTTTTTTTPFFGSRTNAGPKGLAWASGVLPTLKTMGRTSSGGGERPWMPSVAREGSTWTMGGVDDIRGDGDHGGQTGMTQSPAGGAMAGKDDATQRARIR
jgi:hypothetical protein